MNKIEFIEFFKKLGFKIREEYKSFYQLDKAVEFDDTKIMSVVFSEKSFYIMLHSKNTGDFIFSKHFNYIDYRDFSSAKTLVNRIIEFYKYFNILF